MLLLKLISEFIDRVKFTLPLYLGIIEQGSNRLSKWIVSGFAGNAKIVKRICWDCIN